MSLSPAGPRGPEGAAPRVRAPGAARGAATGASAAARRTPRRRRPRRRRGLRRGADGRGLLVEPLGERADLGRRQVPARLAPLLVLLLLRVLLDDLLPLARQRLAALDVERAEVHGERRRVLERDVVALGGRELRRAAEAEDLEGVVRLELGVLEQQHEPPRRRVGVARLGLDAERRHDDARVLGDEREAAPLEVLDRPPEPAALDAHRLADALVARRRRELVGPGLHEGRLRRPAQPPDARALVDALLLGQAAVADLLRVRDRDRDELHVGQVVLAHGDRVLLGQAVDLGQGPVRRARRAEGHPVLL